MKKIIVRIISVCFLFITAICTPVNAAVLPSDQQSPSQGNVMIRVEGTYTAADIDKVLQRVNEIRLEACREGVEDPQTGRPLTADDYKPVKWATELEKFALLRAAEISVIEGHIRPSGAAWHENNVVLNGFHSAENLAFGYSLMNSIEGYYSEKSTYVNKENGVTGHYTSMIDPEYTLIGIGAFTREGSYCTSAMEFGYEAGENPADQAGISGKASQLVEVSVSEHVSSFTLSGSKTISVGSKSTFKAEADIDGTVFPVYSGLKWTSSNTAAAAVTQSGVVTAVKSGSAVIKAAAGGKSASLTVKCAVLPESVSLNYTKKTILKGSKLQLKASVLPADADDRSVSWTSSNTSCAAVSAAGVVTAKAPGTAVITAKTKSGNKTAVCRITVKSPVTGISFSKKSVSVKKGKTVKLKAVIAPSDASNKAVTWKSSNTAVASVTQKGVVKALKPGKSVITVKTKDGKKTAKCNVYVPGWIKKGTKRRYFGADGKYAASKWVKISGKWYHFDAKGYMQKGWIKVSKKWYYLTSSGAMKTGWLKSSGKWYYFNKDGTMRTAPLKLNGKTYRFKANGVCINP